MTTLHDPAHGSTQALTGLVREVLTHHVMEVSPHPMLLVDGDGSVILANRAAEALGWTAEHLDGRRWDDVVVAEYLTDSAHMVSSNVAASAPGVAVARAARIRHANGAIEDARLVTYRLWLSGTAPCVVIAETRGERGACLAGAR